MGAAEIKYKLSVEVASEMGNSICAEFSGPPNPSVEQRILEHFKVTNYLDFDEIPPQFKRCEVFFHKQVDIHEAAAIMSAPQKAKPSANTQIDDEGFLDYCPTNIKSCQAQGEISWPGGEIRITRILMPSLEDDKYHLVIINS